MIPKNKPKKTIAQPKIVVSESKKERTQPKTTVQVTKEKTIKQLLIKVGVCFLLLIAIV